MGYEPLYLEYLVYFNRDRDYFECHEVLEELWLAKDKDPVYKGLLQIAVGLFHFRNNNVRGGRMMLESAVFRLERETTRELGIDLVKLVLEVKDYAARLEQFEHQPFAYYDLTIDIIDSVLADEVSRVSDNLQPNIPQRRKPQRPSKTKNRH
ncbi:DUF309 domain-containing protein [Paenibacillus sp. GCM10012306]|uniref:DUF309 domain-containing protein n=1 Tax=Paenibacillus sp. GCM10012306 TaxID=3317342 RepID=UPI003619C05C